MVSGAGRSAGGALHLICGLSTAKSWLVFAIRRLVAEASRDQHRPRVKIGRTNLLPGARHLTERRSLNYDQPAASSELSGQYARIQRNRTGLGATIAGRGYRWTRRDERNGGVLSSSAMHLVIGDAEV